MGLSSESWISGVVPAGPDLVGAELVERLIVVSLGEDAIPVQGIGIS